MIKYTPFLLFYLVTQSSCIAGRPEVIRTLRIPELKGTVIITGSFTRFNDAGEFSVVFQPDHQQSSEMICRYQGDESTSNKKLDVKYLVSNTILIYVRGSFVYNFQNRISNGKGGAIHVKLLDSAE